MVERKKLMARAQEMAEKVWDSKSIEAWFKKLARDGIPVKKLDPKKIVARKQQVLDGVQRRAEECTYLGHV